MTIRTRVCVLATLALLGAALPAQAQQVPADANKALWCATAFTLVEPQARAQGQTTAADSFKKYSDTLSQTSHDSLSKAGFTEDQIKAQGTAYSDKVSKELTGNGEAEFSVVECTELVDPAAAAAIKSEAPPPDAAAPATGETPAPGTAAPAPADAAPAPAAGGTTPAPAAK